MGLNAQILRLTSRVPSFSYLARVSLLLSYLSYKYVAAHTAEVHLENQSTYFINDSCVLPLYRT